MKIKRLFLTVLMFSLCLVPVFSATSAEEEEEVMTLRNIDKLIKDTNYDKALEELNKYIDKYPENFDNAQYRVAKIMTARRRYTVLAQELIRLINEEPDNAEKIYKVTYELEHLEKYPSDKQLAFIRETRVAAEFSYFRKEFARVQEETEALVKSGDYVAGVQKAREGFVLYQEGFFDDWTQEEIVVPVQGALTSIDETIALYVEAQKTLNDSVQEFIKAVNAEKQDDITKTFAAVNSEFKKFADLRNRIYSSGEVFKTAFEYQKSISETELTDASFLPFVSRFTLGMAENPDTGIAGAMDAQWNNLCNQMKNAVSEKLNNYVAVFESSIPETILREDSPPLNMQPVSSVKTFSELAVQVNGLYQNLTPSLNEDSVMYYEALAKYSYEMPLQLEALYSKKNDILGKVNTLKNVSRPENPSNAELENSSYTTNLINAANAVKIEKNLSLNEVPWAKDYVALGVTSSRPVMEERYSTFVTEFYDYTGSVVSESFLKLCDYFNESDEYYAKKSSEDYDNARKLYEGIPSEDGLTFERYPEKALAQTDLLKKEVADEISVIDRHLGILPLVNEKDYAGTTEEKLLEYRRILEGLVPVTEELASLSRTRLNTAQLAKSEAELRFNQAEIALQADNFDTARKRLQDSRNKYVESLESAFSLELQASSDQRLQELGVRINQKENEVVVRDVRQLKNRAKTEYYAGNFEMAENLLVEAAARWAVTNVEEDAEISNLQAVVNTALSMKTGRVILPSSPLYAEMSQLLSIAAQYYNEGSDLIQKKKTEEGEAVLQSALKKIQELQLVYPLNQDAALLSLRIQKVLNPTDFDSMFSRKVEEARISYRDKTRQQEAYTDLLDLYEINPKYPGLGDLIYNVELEIGIRKKPVDRTTSTQAVALTKDAVKLYQNAKGNEDKLREALKVVDRAIAMNPDDTEAIQLKDKIQTEIGGNASAVMSFEDERRYQLAIQALQKNNIITANAIVEQLLQKASNQKSAKILELQKKIKALL
ncbi:MAG: hypothetical protein HUK25_10200 [Treponema sp.]|nr:hypothetical protein [Treponema sp.]